MKASALPVELLYQILEYLSPTDFNAARHVCRSWLLASLDTRLLCKMLRRAGWSSFLDSIIAGEDDGSLNNIILELRLSCALARVCALGPDWTGPGVRFVFGSGLHPTGSALRKCALVETSEIDFTELSSGSQESVPHRASGLVFTVSACGRFLMLADGDMIYVYRLGPGSDMELVARVACPRRVLGVSMDTTCGRYAVAAILDCRVGIVCDLELHESIVSENPEERQHNFSRHSTHCLVLHDGDSSDESVHSNASRNSSPLALISAEDSSLRKRTISVAANEIPVIESQALRQDRSIYESDTKCCPGYGEASSKTPGRSPCPTLVPNEQTVYHDLCYPDDPPRTVAICPSRSCVAFGCNAGIQLHWIDVVTERKEDRFFPLSATTDVLYFLPPRFGIDLLPKSSSHVTAIPVGSEARRLRLIGSAVAPQPSTISARTELSRRMFGATDTTLRSKQRWGIRAPLSFSNDVAIVESATGNQKKSSHERLQEDWSLAELEGSVKQKVRGGTSPFRQHRHADEDFSLADLWFRRLSRKPPRPNFDHYRAVPLSDGHHVLFTDPSTGVLCLGCDAPFERPVKLTRKIVLEPPVLQGQNTSTEQVWRKSLDLPVGKEKVREKRKSSSHPLTHSEDEGGFRQAARDNKDKISFPTVYAAGPNLENGVYIAAGYEEELVLFTIPPDIFAVSQRELQPVQDKHETGGDWLRESIGATSSSSGPSQAEAPSQIATSTRVADEKTMDWLESWPDTVSWSMAALLTGVDRTDSSSAPDGPGFFNSPPLKSQAKHGFWPLKIRGARLAKISTLVDVAVQNENNELVVWAFGADGHAHVFEIDSARVGPDGYVPLRRKSVIRTGDVNGEPYEENSGHFKFSNLNESSSLDGCQPTTLELLRRTSSKNALQKVQLSKKRSWQKLVDSDGTVEPNSRRQGQTEGIKFTDNTSGRPTVNSTDVIIPPPSVSETGLEASAQSQSESNEYAQSSDPSPGNHFPDYLGEVASYDFFSLSPRPPPLSLETSRLSRTSRSSNKTSDIAQSDFFHSTSILNRTHEFRRADPQAWQTDLDEVPYELLVGDGRSSNLYWDGYQSGRLSSFRPDFHRDS